MNPNKVEASQKLLNYGASIINQIIVQELGKVSIPEISGEKDGFNYDVKVRHHCHCRLLAPPPDSRAIACLLITFFGIIQFATYIIVTTLVCSCTELPRHCVSKLAIRLIFCWFWPDDQTGWRASACQLRLVVQTAQVYSNTQNMVWSYKKKALLSG